MIKQVTYMSRMLKDIWAMALVTIILKHSISSYKIQFYYDIAR